MSSSFKVTATTEDVDFMYRILSGFRKEISINSYNISDGCLTLDGYGSGDVTQRIKNLIESFPVPEKTTHVEWNVEGDTGEKVLNGTYSKTSWPGVEVGEWNP